MGNLANFPTKFHPSRFTRDAYGNVTAGSEATKRHLLSGTWQRSTLKHYSSGVLKLLRFASSEGISRSKLLPIEPDVLNQFIVWCSLRGDTPVDGQPSPRIAASTIRCYIAGLKAWQAFHGVSFPPDSNNLTSLLLLSTRRLEARYTLPCPKRPPALVEHLHVLATHGDFNTAFSQTAFTAALCAFWGMARLGELISDGETSTLPRWRDLTWAKDGSYVWIAIREAKTAAPGEIQFIHVQRQNTTLDAVSALKNLGCKFRFHLDDPVFSWREGPDRRTLTKKLLMDWCNAAWMRSDSTRQQGRPMTGHSFRIGGASLRWNLGLHREDLKRGGRWLSDSYKLYLRRYSEAEMHRTKYLLKY